MGDSISKPAPHTIEYIDPKIANQPARIASPDRSDFQKEQSKKALAAAEQRIKQSSWKGQEKPKFAAAGGGTDLFGLGVGATTDSSSGRDESKDAQPKSISAPKKAAFLVTPNIFIEISSAQSPSNQPSVSYRAQCVLSRSIVNSLYPEIIESPPSLQPPVPVRADIDSNGDVTFKRVAAESTDSDSVTSPFDPLSPSSRAPGWTRLPMSYFGPPLFTDAALKGRDVFQRWTFEMTHGLVTPPSPLPNTILAAAVLCYDSSGGVFVTKRVGHHSFPNMWVFPGGAVSKSERIETAVMRELKEETGLSIVPSTLQYLVGWEVITFRKLRQYCILLFSAQLTDNWRQDIALQADEVAAAALVPPPLLPQIYSPGVPKGQLATHFPNSATQTFSGFQVISSAIPNPDDESANKKVVTLASGELVEKEFTLKQLQGCDEEMEELGAPHKWALHTWLNRQQRK